MKKSPSTIPPDRPTDIIRYVQSGLHAFVACDELAKRDHIVQSLQDALDEHPVELIDGGQVLDRRDFALRLVTACQRLVSGLEGPPLQGRPSIAGSLEEAMLRYRDEGRQGFLLLNDMDPVIEMQRTIEFEGPLRSVMQRYDDVAVVLLASNDTINHLVGDYDRPFYMSFRVFRI